MIKDFILKRVESLKKEKGIISIAIMGSYARNEEEKYVTYRKKEEGIASSI